MIYHPEQLYTLCSYFYFHDFNFDRDIPKWFEGLEPPIIFADSGAFSAHVKGLELNIHDYAQWLKTNLAHFKTYANLDVIRDPIATRRNQELLEDKYGLEPLPVFHLGSDFSHLEHYINRGYSYIALGGMAALSRFPKTLYPFLIKAFKMGEEAGVFFHGFGLTNYRLMRSFKWFTVDSITWLSGAKFNNVPLWDHRRKRIVNFEPNRAESLKAHHESVRALGFNPADFYLGGRKRHYYLVCLLGAATFWAAERHLRESMGLIHHETLGDGMRLYLGDSVYWNQKSYKVATIWRMVLEHGKTV